MRYQLTLHAAHRESNQRISEAGLAMWPTKSRTEALMKTIRILFVTALVLMFASLGFAQRGTYHGNGGHIPPPPVARSGHIEREGEAVAGGRVDNRPHVNNDHWYGHDSPDDPRFRLDHPYAHGRFTNFGPGFQYHFAGIDPGRHIFWFNDGFSFEIAPWDWDYAADWCWTCPNDIVVYEDPDHPGWYIIYNTDTGVYVHAQYIGMH
jgi:hypothetical protein